MIIRYSVFIMVNVLMVWLSKKVVLNEVGKWFLICIFVFGMVINVYEIFKYCFCWYDIYFIDNVWNKEL